MEKNWQEKNSSSNQGGLPDGTQIASNSNRGLNRTTWRKGDDNKSITTDSDFGKRIRDAVQGMGNIQAKEREKDYSIGGNFVATSTTKKKKKKNNTTMAASYKPQGGTLKETTFDRIKKARKKFDYEGKPTSTDDGYPENPPAELGKDGFHSEYGKNSNRYKKLDPISAKAMARVKTGDPETDAVVQKQAKKKK